MTNFAGVSFGVFDNRIAVVATSTGFVAHKSEGMRTREVLACLLSLDVAPVYCVYDCAVDYELVFRDLNQWDKDKLFGIWRAKEESIKDTPLYNADRQAEAVEYQGARLHYLGGKIFKLRRLGPKRKGLTIYDIASYFDYADTKTAAARYLNETLPVVERNMLDLWTGATRDALIERCQCEAELIARLAARVESAVEPLDLKLRQWYGPSAVAAKCLNKWKARAQAKRLNDRNSPHELLQAIDRAYFGGRVEAIKLGTLRDISVIDINSAYAYATAMLCRFAKPLRFTRTLELDNPFSVWLIDYKLPKDAILGALPTRAPAGAISFRLEGRGYFWQPEVEYMAQRYPGRFRVRWGYIARDAEPVTFGPQIQELYDYRMLLKAQGDAAENIIKLTLASLYGKFAQNQGAAWFQCRAWAGWITSYVRRMLLDAVTGNEDKVISFNQDAIHFEAGANIRMPIGEGLGEWKLKRFASGLYVAPGIYDLQDAATKGKRATRGVNMDLDFDRIARELSDRQVAELARTFFVGWQLARMAAVKYEKHYLSDMSETLRILPLKLRARNYQANFDWFSESRTSTINKRYGGTISALYHPADQNHCLRLQLKDRGWA